MPNKVFIKKKKVFRNCNLGMPLKVFVNKGYLEIDIKEDIVDFRSKTELREKVIQIEISTILISLFKSHRILNNLNERIKIK
jgi:hypothetical protein